MAVEVYEDPSEGVLNPDAIVIRKVTNGFIVYLEGSDPLEDGMSVMKDLDELRAYLTEYFSREEE